MKKAIHLLAAILLSTSVLAYVEPYGTCLTWFGYNALDYADGNYSVFLGSYSGKYGSMLDYSSFLGVMSGAYSSNLKSCNAMGYYAMENAQDCYQTVAIGPHAAYNAGSLYRGVFIGNNAGRDAYGCTNCVFIGNNAGRDMSYGRNVIDINGTIFFNGSTLFLNADKIVRRPISRDAWLNANADIYLSSEYGSDENDGLSAASAVKSISRAVEVANDGVGGGDFEPGREIVVATDMGQYKSCTFEVDTLITNGVTFVACCEKGFAEIVPEYTGELYNGIEKMRPLYCKKGKAAFDGFTVTKFDGAISTSYATDFYMSAIVSGKGLTLRRCEFTRNTSTCKHVWISCDLDDCDIYDNVLLPHLSSGSWTAAYCVFGDEGGYRTYTFRNCRIRDNDFSAGYFGRSLKMVGTVVVNDFFKGYGLNYSAADTTIIANHFSNPQVIGMSDCTNRIAVGRNFIVCPDFGGCSDARNYRDDAGVVIVSNANLTADWIAADVTCPSVRGDGSPDYGYRSSSFGPLKTLQTRLAGILTGDGIALTDANGVKLIVRNVGGELRVTKIVPDEPEPVPDEEQEPEEEHPTNNAPLLMGANPGASDDDDHELYRYVK